MLLLGPKSLLHSVIALLLPLCSTGAGTKRSPLWSPVTWPHGDAPLDWPSAPTDVQPSWPNATVTSIATKSSGFLAMSTTIAPQNRAHRIPRGTPVHLGKIHIGKQDHPHHHHHHHHHHHG